MTIWWVTLVISFVICFIASKIGKRVYLSDSLVRYKPNKIIALISCIILILVAGLRSNVGDTGTYMFSYVTKIPDNIINFLSATSFEGDWGFDLFQTIIKQFFGNNPQYLIFICSLITILSIFIILYKYSDSLELAIFYFITAGNYLVTMNGIRQYLVSSILFLAFPWVVKRKWYLYIPLVLLLSTMHSSALIFVPLYFIVNARAWGKITKWILLVGIGLFITYPISGPIIADLLGESQYGHYANELISTGGGANFLRVIVYAVPVFLAYRGKNNQTMLSKPEYNLVVNMSCINLVSILLATRYWLYARFNMYFSLYAILLLCWDVKYLNKRYRQIIYVGSILAYAIYYWYEMHISLGQVYMSNFF